MRQLKFDDGGRPFANDDLEALQADLTYATTAAFQELPPHVVANCKVSYRGGNLYDIGYGIVWLAGQLLKFDGASGVTMPAEIVLAEVAVYDERPYSTGTTKPCIIEQRTTVRPATSENVAKVNFNNQGATLTSVKVAESRFRSIGEVQALASLTADDYDSSGRGRLGTVSYGWALCDGREGRADLLARFIVGINPEHPDYDTIGKIGGAASVELTPAQGPSHSHGLGNGLARSGSDVTFTGGRSDAKAVNNANGSLRNTENAGSGQAHENRPPFYVLAYRQWIGF